MTMPPPPMSQPQPQPPVGVPLPVPMRFTVEDDPNFPHLVRLRVETPVGLFVFIMDPACADSTGAALAEAAQHKRHGIITPPGSGGLIVP